METLIDEISTRLLREGDIIFRCDNEKESIFIVGDHVKDLYKITKNLGVVLSIECWNNSKCKWWKWKERRSK